MRSKLLCVASACLVVVACDSDEEKGDSEPAPPPQGTTAASEPTTSEEAEPSAPIHAGPKSTAYDFMANRHLAHLWNGALLVDLGTPSALKYVGDPDESGWTDSTEVDDVLAAYVDGTDANWTVPLRAPSNAELEGWHVSIRMRPIGRQRCSFFVRPTGGEETEFATLDGVTPGWNVHTFPLDVASSGEHHFRVECSKSRPADKNVRSAAAVDWIAIGGKKTKVARRDNVFDTLGNRVRLGEGDAASWYLPLAEGAEFHAGVEGLVRMNVASNGEEKSFESDLGKFKVNLGEFAGEPVRIEFVARGSATVTRPRIDVPKKEAIAKPKAPKYVVVWIAEGLRADHLKPFVSGATADTPNYEAFAAEATVFERAIAQSDHPAGNAATIFTGAYPGHHRVAGPGGSLSSKTTSLGQPFRAIRWRTGLFSATPAIAGSDFERGFREIEARAKGEPLATDALWSGAEEWLQEANPPVFLVVNTGETSPPLRPPSTLVSNYADGAAPDGLNAASASLYRRLAAGQRDLNDAQLDHLRNVYRASVSQNDLWFGSMLETLNKLGIRDDTMVVVTSTGGLGLGEYGEFGWSVRPESVWVPLMIQYRGWRREAGRVPATVELVDVYETLMELTRLGHLDEEHLQGESVRHLMVDPTARHPRPGFSYEGTDLAAVRLANHSYWPGEQKLFRLSDRPPLEGEEVSPDQAIPWRAMRDFTPFHVRFAKTWDKSAWGHPNDHSEDGARELDRRGW